MGMRRPIIHGMHTLGRACAALERLHARPLTLLDARFLAPVPLGSTVTLGTALDADASGGAFSVDRRVGAERRSAVGGRFALAGDALGPESV